MQEKSAKSGAFKRVEVKNYGLLFFCMLRFGALHPEISGIRERREKERNSRIDGIYSSRLSR
ncbi:hypothetical protein A2961_00825 [Candidatus Woesebacteria bacterium RIFCSPLOWO2_01_FULL_39_21]|uniref:Uncharacterized protein n=1 Tax=Candidatus Woesebacteria bacterium RIFCSPLOWO2_01_FULL_39_21 TaxID=1802519 RepID=A0A1F8BMC5_9BACT|nr:MAG: hypothetical protein A2691_02120 [Candidatus Woesebacteria bacterium RIFCSPHIGHO2_01_FULL_39_23]OGM65224.1 MAG: hypothetical protein A2961_00825 [Candidatus Woesebacteria bacterium RIFCSPLOWO2_01_FULL_39_21]